MGRVIRLAFRAEVLNSLTVTVPRMVAAAFRRCRDEPGARPVYLLAEARTELSTDLSARILALESTVSFAANDDRFRELVRSGAQSAEMQYRLTN
jgi:enoyl-CoA hydratase/carnithine racemase